MTFLENLEPLLKAAEQYAMVSELREGRNGLELSRKPGVIVNLQHEAETELLKAAIEYAEWGNGGYFLSR